MGGWSGVSTCCCQGHPYSQTKHWGGKVHEVYFRDHGLTNQTNNSYVAEVEVVDTSDCHSEDSGFEPRRSRQPDTDAFIAS